MQLTLLSGYPDNVGRRHIWCGHGKGPSSYSQANKDPLERIRLSWWYDAIIPALTTSGTYRVEGIASGVGPRQEWKLKWVVAATGAEVANGTNLSTQTVQLAGFGGQY